MSKDAMCDSSSPILCAEDFFSAIEASGRSSRFPELFQILADAASGIPLGDMDELTLLIIQMSLAALGKNPGLLSWDVCNWLCCGGRTPTQMMVACVRRQLAIGGCQENSMAEIDNILGLPDCIRGVRDEGLWRLPAGPVSPPSNIPIFPVVLGEYPC